MTIDLLVIEILYEYIDLKMHGLDNLKIILF
jgi:hypothetical protein